MKLQIATTLVIGLFVSLLQSCNQQGSDSTETVKSNTVSKETEESEIKKIIAEETAAFVDRDSTKLLSFYSADDITQSAWNSPDGSYGTLKGIDKIRSNFREAFKKNPERQNLSDVERSNWFFRHLSNEWVWVNFNQKIKLLNGEIYSGYETRLMKKETIGWKISVMYALTDHGH